MSARTPPHGPGDAATWPACSGHPNDPRTPEPECGLISLQPLGEAEALVEFDQHASGLAVTGACVGGYWIDADCFSASQILTWITAIAAELQREREADELDLFDE